MKSDGLSTVSATIRRMASDLRRRRIRTRGKDMGVPPRQAGLSDCEDSITGGEVGGQGLACVKGLDEMCNVDFAPVVFQIFGD